MIWEYIIQGGYIIFVLFIFWIIGIAIFLERFFYLKNKKRDGKIFLFQVKKKIISEGKIGALEYSRNEGCFSFLSQIFELILKNKKIEINQEKLIKRFWDKLIIDLEVRINLLGTIASISPLIGLLGTVLGMIESLKELDKLNLIQSEGIKTNKILDGIWSSLITTAGGLIVAIPSISGYNYLISKINYFLIDIKNESNEVLDMIKEIK